MKKKKNRGKANASDSICGLWGMQNPDMYKSRRTPKRRGITRVSRGHQSVSRFSGSNRYAARVDRPPHCFLPHCVFFVQAVIVLQEKKRERKSGKLSREKYDPLRQNFKKKTSKKNYNDAYLYPKYRTQKNCKDSFAMLQSILTLAEK